MTSRVRRRTTAAHARVHLSRAQAAIKLVANHEPLLRDVTNAAPSTQQGLKRVGVYDAPYVDMMLLETTRRLLGYTPTSRATFEQLEQKLSPLQMGMDKAWVGTATYLDQRIQSSVGQKPGRAPDLSEEAARAMKAVMFELAPAPYPVGPTY